MDAENLTLGGMRRGVEDSDYLLLALTQVRPAVGRRRCRSGGQPVDKPAKLQHKSCEQVICAHGLLVAVPAVLTKE